MTRQPLRPDAAAVASSPRARTRGPAGAAARACAALCGALDPAPYAAGEGTALDVKASGEKTFYVNPRAGNSQITDFSRSTLEDFTTVCNQVSGQWQLDPKNLEATKGRFALKVDDLHTGIALRDHDLRGADWFDAAKYPDVVVEINKVEDVKKTGANTATMKLAGTCAMHGKTNPVTINATLAYLDESPQTQKLVRGDVCRIRADFQVKLSDFGITGPPGSETIGVKVADAQDVQVTVFGATEKPPEALKTDTQPAGGATPKPPEGAGAPKPKPPQPKPPQPPAGGKLP